MNRTATSLLVVLCFLLPTRIPAQPSGATRILFIGNSYTYFNNLPEIFAKLAQAGHRGKIETRMVAPGGWRLKDHWEKGTARKSLNHERWDFVVLQDQSTLGMHYLGQGNGSRQQRLRFPALRGKVGRKGPGKGCYAVFPLDMLGLGRS